MPRRNTSKTTPTTIDEYLAPFDADKRAALERLRRIIRKAIPRAEECMSYRLPAVRLDGRVLVWFGATDNHCAFYPGGVVGQFEKELEEYDTSKGTIRFQPDRPLPAALVRRLLKARIAAVSARASRTGGRRGGRQGAKQRKS